MYARNKITQSLLYKNPKFTKHQIGLVIGAYLKSINKKLHNHTFSLKVPKLGIIHTHGNAKNKTITKKNKNQYKKNKLKYDFSDKKLLF